MRVLITGVSGFIASHLALTLADRDHDVVTVARDGSGDLQGDLRDMAFCERAVNRVQPEAVFHLAAQAIVPVARRDPWGTFEDNVRGTYNLLEAVARYAPEASTVVASSDKAYGEGEYAAYGYHEDDALVGRGPYDCSKACTDLIAHSYALEGHMRVAVVRAGNVYGPGDRHLTRVIPSLIDGLLVHGQAVIQSDGSPVRDYLYITDAVEGYCRVLDYITSRSFLELSEGSFHTAFNLAGGEPVSVLRLCGLITEAVGEVVGSEEVFEDPMVLGNRVGEISYQHLNTDLARRVLGWQPQVDLRAGLLRTVMARASELGISAGTSA